MTGPVWRADPQACPHCGYVIDAAGGGNPPAPGDFAICFRCTKALRFVPSPFQAGELVLTNLRPQDEQEFVESGGPAEQRRVQLFHAAMLAQKVKTPRCPACGSEPVVDWVLPFFCANAAPRGEGGCNVLSWDPLKADSELLAGGATTVELPDWFG